MVQTPTPPVAEPAALPAAGAASPPVGGALGRAERAAVRAGLAGSAVERLPFDLSALEDEGLFVNVDARGFGLLDRRLDWQALGVALPRDSALAFRPPRCGLLPDRHRLALLRPAGRAHAALHKYSYRFRLTETLFETPAYRWVPWRAFETFEREFRAAQAALEAARAEVLERYDAVREEVVETFLRLAANSARRLAATGQAPPAGFEDAVVRGVLAAFPSEAALRERLALDYRVGVVLLGSEMLAEQRRAREERRRLEAARRPSAWSSAGGRPASGWCRRSCGPRRSASAGGGRPRRRSAGARPPSRSACASSGWRRPGSACRRRMSPLEEGARQLRAAVYEAAVALRASLQKHGRLHGASAKKARDLARWFGLMRWGSDPELEALLCCAPTVPARPVRRR